MDVFDYIQHNGEKVIPNPNYNPKSKKNQQPKYISVADTSGEETDHIVKSLRDNINEDYALPVDVAQQYGKFGIDPSRRFHQNLEYEIADAQSTWTKVGNALLQTLSEVGLGTIQTFTDLPSSIRGGVGVLIDGILSDVFNVKGDPVQNALGVDKDDPYGNAISDTIQEWRDAVQNDIAPVYVAPGVDIDTGGLSSASWYLQNLPNLATSLTLLLPTKAVTGALGLVTKGIRAANTARKTEKLIEQANKVKSLSNLAKTEEASRVAKELSAFDRFRYNPIYQARAQRAATDFGEGLVMRTIENYQEAHQTYQDMYATASEKLAGMDNSEYANFLEDNKDELQADGVDTTNKDQVAKWVAKKAADRTFRLDYSNLLFDVIQLHSVRDIGKTAKRVTSPSIKRLERKAKETFGKSSEELAKGAGTSKLKELGKTIVDYTTGASKKVLSEASEGIEEAINYIAQQEGITYGNTLLDGETDSTLGSFWNHRLRDYLNNSELHESAFWGVAGGLVFGKFAGAYNRIQQYRANKELENARKENKATGEQVTTNDSANPLNDFIRLSEMPEIQAAKEAINRRGSRAEQLFKDLEDIKEGKDPYNGRKEFDGDKEIAAALARTRAIQEFRYELAMDAINSGTYDSLIDWFKDDRVKEVFGANTEDGGAFVEESIKDLETAKNAYYNELAHVNAQVAQINARRKTSDKVPLEYVQILARNNAARRLEIHGLERQIKSLEIQEADELNNTNIQLNESMDVRKTVRMSMLADRYARLEADKRAVKEDEELSDWRKAQSVKDIESQQDTIVRMITDENMVPATEVTVKDGDEELKVAGKARALGVALQAFRMAKAYRKVAANDYRLDEREFGKTDEELIKEYESVFKNAPVSNTVIGQMSRVFNKELTDLTNETGLIKQNKKLYDLYANLAVLENQRAITGSEINSTETQIRTAIDVLHNQRNQVRADMIMKAQRTIRELHDKYKDTASSDIERVVIAAYMQDPEEATRIARESLTGVNEEGHKDSEKLISALAIINFSQASNTQALEYIGTVLQLNAERHKKQNQSSTISEKPSQASQNAEVNNVSTQQANTQETPPTAQINDTTAQTNQPQPTTQSNEQPTVADATITSSDNDRRSNGKIFVTIEDGKATIKVGIGDPNAISSKVSGKITDGTYREEILISELPKEQQTPYILSDLFNQVSGDILNPSLSIRITKNPIASKEQGFGKQLEIIEKGELELINTRTGEVVESTNTSISSTGEEVNPPVAPVAEAPQEEQEAPVSPQTSGLTEVQKEDIIEQAIGQFFDITAENPNYDEAAASAKEYILQTQGDKIPVEEIDRLIKARLDEFKWALGEMKKFGASGLEAEADRFTLAARYEEKSLTGTSNMFRGAAESFIKAYVDEYIMPIIDGKQVVKLRDILNICNKRAKTDGNDVAKSMYVVVSNYLLSPEGRAKYIVLDEADIKQNKVLNSIGKTAKELIDENIGQFEQRADIDLQRELANQSGDNSWFKVMRELRVGDILTCTNEKIPQRHDKKGTWGLAFRKGNVLVATMPLPYIDGKGGYYYYNEGWKTDVHLEDGNPAGEFLDLLRRIFIPNKDDASALDLRNIVYDPSLARDDKGNINVSQEIVKKFSENPIIEDLVHQSVIAIQNDNGPGNNRVYIDKQNGPDYVNMVRHLRKLADYAESCVGIDSREDDLNMSLNSWCYMLYQNYDNIRRQDIVENKGVGAKIEVPITEITDGGVNLIVSNPDVNEDVYDKLLPVKMALSPNQKARIAIVNPTSDNEIIISPESGDVQDAYDNESSFKAANTLIALFDRNNTISYVTALGTRFSDKKTLDSPTWTGIKTAMYNGLLSIMDDLVNNRDKKSIIALEDFLTKFIATPDTPTTIVPLLRAHHGEFTIDIIENDNYDGINISFENANGVSVVAAYSRTRYGKVGYMAENGSPISLDGKTDAAKILTDNILKFLLNHASINIDAKGILADSDGTVTDGWLKKEINIDGKSKFVIDIPGPKAYREEFDSYNDFLIKNNFIRVNTYTEDESNFSAQGENQAANQVLRVELPDMREETTPPVKGNDGDVDTTLTDPTSDKETYAAIQTILDTNKDHAGLEVFRYLKGDALVERLNQLMQELGIEEGFDIFPARMTYNRFYNYKTDSNEDGGFIASTNPYGYVVKTKYHPRGAARIGGVDMRRDLLVQSGDTIFGFKLLNMLSSKNEARRNKGLRKLIHERIHQIIHNPNLTPDTRQLLDGIERVYKVYVNESAIREATDEKRLKELRNKDRTGLSEEEVNDLNNEIIVIENELKILANARTLFNSLSGDTLLEEFITEGMTNEVLYKVMNSLDYRQGSDEYLDNIPQGKNKSLFAKLMDLIFKLFNWNSREELGPIRKEGIYEKFYETLRNAFTESSETTTTSKEITKEESNNESTKEPTISDESSIQDVEVDDVDFDAFDASYEELTIENAGYGMIPNTGVVRRNLPIEQRVNFDNLIQSGIITYKCL